MRIHLGGSSKGYRECPELYKLINDTIKSLGHSISNEWVHDTNSGNDTVSDKFKGTLKGISKADALVLEKTNSSLEVGQQYHMGLERNLPVLFLCYNENARGGAVGSVKDQNEMNYLVDPAKIGLMYIADYNKSNIRALLSNYFDIVKEKHKTARFNLVLEKYLDNYLKDLANKNNTSKSDEIRRLILKDMEKR